jgi:circadian clock protein KaiC
MPHATEVSAVPPPPAATGIAGLDAILQGGLPREEMHLVQGGAGTGKTTIALQFLLEGIRNEERTLYVTLSQSKAHLERIARSHGWSLEGMAIHEMSPGTVAERIAARQTILPTAEVELGEAFGELVALVESVSPRRAVIDSITIVQLLAGNVGRYHREVVNLRQLFVERGCTVMALADHPAVGEEGQSPEVIFHPLSGCVIQLDQAPRLYGDVRRRLRVVKARGVAHQGGYHDLKILTSGMQVYARLGAYQQPDSSEYRAISTNVEGLNTLVGGGLSTGTSCLIVGPSGVGKSSVAGLYAESAARAGDHAAIFLLDERPETYVTRSENVGIHLRDHMDAGRMLVRQLDPGEIAPGEFAQQVRQLVIEQSVRVVIMDSVIGYFAAMGPAEVLLSQLHELMTFLTRNGVLLLMCGAQEGFMSIGTQNAVDVSYLSDSILALTFFEAEGRLRRAVAVVKKKHGAHLHTIHELFLDTGNIRVGAQPLAQFQNLMVGAHPGQSLQSPGRGETRL